MSRYINETIEINGKYIHRHSIYSDGISYCVYEPSAVMGMHSTITHLDGYDFWMGKLSTAPLPEHLDKLPSFSDERYDAVMAHIETLYQKSYDLILQAYPHLAETDYSKSMGDITTWNE